MVTAALLLVVPSTTAALALRPAFLRPPVAQARCVAPIMDEESAKRAWLAKRSASAPTPV